MKKLFKTILWGGAAICLLIASLFCVACGGEHEHGTAWTYVQEENNQHTKKCDVDGCEGVLEDCDFVRVVTTEAACTTAGVAKFTCVCGRTYNEPITATGHQLTKHDAKSAECTVDGNTLYYECTVCEKYYSDEAGTTEITDKTTVVIAATGHNYGTLVAAKEATCSAKGNIAHYKCSVCNKYFDTDKKEITKAQTETAINATAHNYGTLVAATPATCSAKGNIAYYQCSLCEKYFNESKTEITKAQTEIAINATAHNYGDPHDAQEETCTVPGNIKYYQCSLCDKYFNENKTEITQAQTVIPAGHKGTITYTYTNNDTHEGKCERATCPGIPGTCGYDVVEDNRPSCDESGDGVKECRICHHREDITLAAGQHSLGQVAEVAATATAHGHNAYYECSKCHSLFADANGETPTTAEEQTTHYYGEWQEEQAATCIAEGTVGHYNCLVPDCGKHFGADNHEITNITLPIDSNAHDFTVEWSWATDKSTATVTLTCGNSAAHNHTSSAITSESDTTGSVSCTTSETTDYSVSYTYAGATFTDEQTVTIDAWGHIYVGDTCVRCDDITSESLTAAGYSTVAVHDPSIVVAYEDADHKTYATAGAGRTKIYYVFGTQGAQAYSYDLINWTSFTNNINTNATGVIPASIVSYCATGQSNYNLLGNLWAPDVIWNNTMNKWCMYLSVNGDLQYSVIVLLTADTLRGDWTYVNSVVFSFGGNKAHTSGVAYNDYKTVTGNTTQPAAYTVYRNSVGNKVYEVNAIDPNVFYDDGKLYMVYGSWFGGIYMLELDPATGLRKASTTYEFDVYQSGASGDKVASINDITSDGSFGAVLSDPYFGWHIAGGHHAQPGGEGPYIKKIGNYYYLFVSYGGYAPSGNYNMRVFRSQTLTGGYVDGGGSSAIFSASSANAYNNPNCRTGLRLMTGYTWSWWDFSYVGQGHNSILVEDGRAYVIYHNKYMDGTVFHVMKVHELFVNSDGWLVAAPFERTEMDKLATNLTMEQVAGTYGVLYMKNDNGTYGNPCTDSAVTLNADGTLTGAYTGTWTYNGDTGEFTVTIGGTTCKGYLLYQTMEGTTIRTLSFTTTAGTIYGGFTHTYWGYKVASEESVVKYLSNSFIQPTRATEAELCGMEVTSSFMGHNGYTVTVNEGKVIFTVGTHTEEWALTAAESSNALEYNQINAGSYLLPVRAETGAKITFTLSGMSGEGADWVNVLVGNEFKLNLATMAYKDTTIFESGSTITSGYAWDSLVNTNATRTVTIEITLSGEIIYYLGDVKVFHYLASTKMNDSNITVSMLAAAILKELQAGTVRFAYDVTDVSVALELTEKRVQTHNVEYKDATAIKTDFVTGLVVEKGEILAVTGSQTAIGASQWNSLIVEFAEGVTLRTDAYGVTFTNDHPVFYGDTWGETGGLTASNKNVVSSTFVNASGVGEDYGGTAWTNVKTLLASCDWVVLVDFAQTDYINVTMQFTGNAGTYKGYIYTANYKIALKNPTTTNSVSVKFGCDQGAVGVIKTSAYLSAEEVSDVKQTQTHNKAYDCTGGWNSNVVTGLIVNTGEVLTVTGSQTAVGGAQWNSLVVEFNEGATLRTDAYGWVFTGTVFEGEAAYPAGGLAASDNNSISSTFVNGSGVGADYGTDWANVITLLGSCDWVVTVNFTEAGYVNVTMQFTGNTGTYNGYVFTSNYRLKVATGTASLNVRLGGDAGAVGVINTSEIR